MASFVVYLEWMSKDARREECLSLNSDTLEAASVEAALAFASLEDSLPTSCRLVNQRGVIVFRFPEGRAQ